MKKKAKEKQITITNPEDFLDLILLYFPREYNSGYEKAKHSLEVMERESKKIKPYSVEEICYWLNLASFADMAIQDIQAHGVVANQRRHSLDKVSVVFSVLGSKELRATWE